MSLLNRHTTLNQSPHSLLYCISVLVLLGVLVTPPVTVAQVTIKENLLIDSLSLLDHRPVKDGSSVGPRTVSTQSSIYLECGGPVTIQPYSPYYQIVLLPSMEVVVNAPAPGQIYNIGTYPAGSTLELGYVLSDEDPRVIPFTTTNTSIGAYQPTAYFYQDLYYFAFYLTVNVGDSSSCLDMRPPTGPPRFPGYIVAPTDTHFTAFLFRDIHTPLRDTLWFFNQHGAMRDSLLLDSTLSWRSTIFDLGSVKAGDSLNMFLKSVIKGTRGETMNAQMIFHPDSPPDPSPFDEWDLNFENWIDSHFRDYRGYIYRDPPRYKITFDKASASPGDTVRFHVEVLGVRNDNSIEAEVDVNILKGREFAVIQDTLGTVYGPDRDEIIPGQGIVYPSFSQISDQLAIVVSDSAPPGGKVIVQVVSQWDFMYGGRAELGIGRSILLGESQYYQARLVDGQLKLEEHASRQSDGLVGVTFKVQPYADPRTANLGRRLGAYYEYRDSAGSALDSTQQVRLVGRYWTSDSIYKVKLTAVYADKADTMIISVDRPSRLGSVDNTATNIYGTTDNLDSLIIAYAGRFGVHPQMIKGIVKRESHFRPAYRYEPFYDVQYLQLKKNSPYLGNFNYRVISASSVGTPDIPSGHLNVAPPTYYLGYVGTIWDFLSQHSRTIDPSSSSDLYPAREGIWAKDPLEQWNTIYRTARLKLRKHGKSPSEASSAARDSAKEWLHFKYANGILNTSVAQTRTAASYGSMQIMYPSANDRGYPRGSDRHLPEYLNINDTLFQYSVLHVQKCLADELKYEKLDGTDNWKLGIDSTYSLALSRYNGGGRDKKGKLISTANLKYGPAVRRIGSSYTIQK